MRIAFALQQCLHGRTSVLRFTYIACLFYTYMNNNLRGMSHQNPLGWPQRRFTIFGDVVDFLLLLGIVFCDCKYSNLKGFEKRSTFLLPHAGVIGLFLSGQYQTIHIKRHISKRLQKT
jgi:hypothetical protein